MITLLTATRVDITFTISLLSRFMHRASEIHLQVAKRVVKCIKDTMNYGIRYSHLQNFMLMVILILTRQILLMIWEEQHVVLDLDQECFHGVKDIRCGCSKHSKSQICSSHCCCESNNLNKKIFADLLMKQLEPTQIYIDNQTTISIANNHVFHGKTKPYKIKLYF